MKIIDTPLMAQIKKPIIPFAPFLIAKAKNDPVLTARLNLIEDGHIPNTKSWSTALDTNPPFSRQAGAINGRWIFHDDEDLSNV